MKTANITGFDGIVNVKDPSGLKQPAATADGFSGNIELVSCVNFDIDDNGGLLKRKDSPEVFSEAYSAKLTQTLAGIEFVAQGSNLRYKKPFSDEYDERRSTIPYKAAIVLIQEVETGMWVSTTEKIFFHAGRNPTTPSGFAVTAEYDFPAIMGTGEKVHASRLGLDTDGFLAVFATTRGICYGTGSGQLVNLSEGRFSYAPGQRGISYLREEDGIVQYQVKMINAGTSYNENTVDENIVVSSL